VITDKERVMDRSKEYYQSKLNDPRQHSEESDSEDQCTDEIQEDIKEPTYLEVRDVILKFKKHEAPGIDGVTADIIQKAGPALWRRIHTLIKEIRNKEQMPPHWSVGIICPIY
jgi:hypothetical protein